MIDPQLDAIIKVPGVCTICGAEDTKSPAPGYCRDCVRKLKGQRAPDNDPQALIRRELAMRELCRRRFLPFIQRMKPTYEAGWFHHDLAARIERFVRRVEAKESPRLIINVPPRHGKTEQASKGLPAWFLGRNPDKGIISATHSDKLATDNSRDVLDYIKHEGYGGVFSGVELKKDNKGATGWRTTQGGSYKPVGVGGGIAGYGGHILIVDDPHRDQDAYSPTVRDSIWQWYKSSFKTRLMPGGGIILVQTRWVLDDLTGRVLEEDGLIEDGGLWEQVCYPAEAVEDEFREPDGRVISIPSDRSTLLRRKNTVLHPERYPAEELAQFKKDPVTWAALYQQNPTAGDAATFTEGLIAMTECTMADTPARLVYYTAYDLAPGQKERNDWCVGMTGGVDEDDVLWITDIERARMDTYDIVESVIANHETYAPDIIGIERTHQQIAVAPVLEKECEDRRIHGINVVELMHGNKDKVTRARPIQARMRQGKVRIPTDAPWYAAFKKELLEFPVGKHDDQVDGFAYLGQLLLEMHTPDALPKAPPEKSWKEKVGGGNRRNKSWKAA